MIPILWVRFQSLPAPIFPLLFEAPELKQIRELSTRLFGMTPTGLTQEQLLRRAKVRQCGTKAIYYSLSVEFFFFTIVLTYFIYWPLFDGSGYPSATAPSEAQNRPALFLLEDLFFQAVW